MAQGGETNGPKREGLGTARPQCRSRVGKNAEVHLLPLRLGTQEYSAGRTGKLLSVSGLEDASRVSNLVTDAARAKFEMSELGVEKLFGGKARLARRVPVLPAVFEDTQDKRLRLVYKEVVARFEHGTPKSTIRKILDKFGFKIRRTNDFEPDQHVLTQATIRYAGVELVEAANDLTELPEVVFATPNFVSEFRREKPPLPISELWHLHNTRKRGEDAHVIDAWAVTRGSSKIVIAIVDDGVDVQHPDLRRRIVAHPDSHDARDKHGRDFFVPNDSLEHYSPVPKRFRYPYDDMSGNDIHGTPCAGVAAADGANGEGVLGAAPGCRILPVKIFHADDLAEDSRVADAIRYASRIARVVSCSWTGPRSPDIMLALEDAMRAHDGKGALVCVASGNAGAARIGYPASDPNCMAIGATTDSGKRASYSNYGSGLSLVAPSNGGSRGIYTTDVSDPGRGFNVGTAEAGDAKGLYTNDFGGTSSATPLVAGIAALVFSANDELGAADVRNVLESTARKPNVNLAAAVIEAEYGHGIVDAAAAVVHPSVRGSAGKPAAPKKKAKKKKASATKTTAKKKAKTRAG